MDLSGDEKGEGVGIGTIDLGGGGWVVLFDGAEAEACGAVCGKTRHSTEIAFIRWSGLAWGKISSECGSLSPPPKAEEFPAAVGGRNEPVRGSAPEGEEEGDGAEHGDDGDHPGPEDGLLELEDRLGEREGVAHGLGGASAPAGLRAGAGTAPSAVGIRGARPEREVEFASD